MHSSYTYNLRYFAGIMFTRSGPTFLYELKGPLAEHDIQWSVITSHNKKKKPKNLFYFWNCQVKPANLMTLTVYTISTQLVCTLHRIKHAHSFLCSISADKSTNKPCSGDKLSSDTKLQLKASIEAPLVRNGQNYSKCTWLKLKLDSFMEYICQVFGYRIIQYR